MARSLISLDIIASGLCDDIGDSVQRHKFKFTRHLIDAFKEVNLYIGESFSVKTAVLQYSNAIEMPCDFMYETKVGVRRNGVIAVLSLDKNVQKEKIGDTEVQKYLNDIWSGQRNYGAYRFYNCFNGSNYLGELYGTGRSVYNNGTYNINKAEGVIYIGSLLPKDTEIIIEYASDGVSKGLELVPIEMKEVLEYYAKFKFYADKNPNLSVLNEQRYKKAYNKLQRYYNFLDALYATEEINKMFSPTNY